MMNARLRSAAIVIVALSVLGGTAVMASAASGPTSGLWEMKPNKGAALASGSLTVRGTSALHIHGRLNGNDPTCPHNTTFSVSGSASIVQVSYGHHHTRWYIASGVGAGDVQSADIRLKVGGRVQTNATTIASFPGRYGKTEGFVGWGDDGSGFQPCGFGFVLKHHWVRALGLEIERPLSVVRGSAG
jgi:hypothetical protein